MTPFEQKLYDRLKAMEVDELEILKEMIDRVIFDKFITDMTKGK